MWAFIPNYHWLPFLVWCISGSRVPVAFFVDDGTALIMASTIEPPHMIQPWVSKISFYEASSFSPRSWASSR